MRVSQIAILGLGNFGTALCRVWGKAGHHIVAWTVEPEVYESITATGINDKYLPDVPLQGVEVTMDLAAAVDGADIVVIALPSSVVLDVVNNVIPHLSSGQVLLDLAKGLAPDDGLISDAIEAKLSAAGKHNPIALIMGPTIAAEVARGVYTTAMMASKDMTLAESLASTLSTDSFRLTATSDPLGAEYWGAFKNVIALACGVSDGLKADGGGGDNLKAAIFTAGFREAVRLLPTLGADPETTLSPAGIGDLYVTATSPFGRNRQMGERLGSGQSLAEAESEMVMVSEGVRATRMFNVLFQRAHQPAPFVEAVCGLLDGKTTVTGFINAVMAI